MKEFTVASTTDTLEDVNLAVGIVPEEETGTSEALPEPEAAPETETGKPEKKPSNGRFSKRIDQITREKYEAQREAAEARVDANRLREQLNKIQGGQKPAETQVAAPEGKPIRSAYQNDEAWVEALADWKYDTRIKADAQRERQIEEEQVLSDYKRRAKEYTKIHPDFDDAIESLRLPEQIGYGVQNALIDMPDGEKVAYYIATNPEVLSELSNMSPARAVAELGAISVGLMPKPSPPKTVSRVPAPISPVGGSSRAEVDPSNMSYREYRKWRGDRR